MTNEDTIARFARFYETLGLELEPFQRLILEEVFSDRRESLVLLPRGNGKTTLMAALALWHLETVLDANCYIAAASRDQASVCLRIASGMVLGDPDLDEHLKVTQREIRTALG